MTTAPFPRFPCKPQVTRLPDGRIGIFIGGAYQFTDDPGALSLRKQLDELLPTPTSREHYEQADRAFIAILTQEMKNPSALDSTPAKNKDRS